ncbi:MAG: HI1506-related protein [Thermodesulfobacteriota bacterium]
MLRITSRKDGFRRCGVAHPATPTEYPADRFTEEEVESLKAEPMLVVEELLVVAEGKGSLQEGSARPNANESIAMVKAAETIEALDKLAEGEDRKGVLVAIEARRKELEA